MVSEDSRSFPELDEFQRQVSLLDRVMYRLKHMTTVYKESLRIAEMICERE